MDFAQRTIDLARATQPSTNEATAATTGHVARSALNNPPVPIETTVWWGGSHARAGQYLARRVLLHLIDFGGQHYERGDATPTRRVRQPD